MDFIQIGIYFIGLIVLFVFLGKAADVTVNNIRVLGRRLRITPFTLGLALGALTTLPELFIGIHASLEGLPQISFGNAMGGIVVLLGLVAGISIIINKTVHTGALLQPKWLMLAGGFILLPMFLALDGVVSRGDGLIIATVYLLIVNGILRSIEHDPSLQRPGSHPERTSKQAVLMTFIGVVGIVVFSRFIISATLTLAQLLSLPLFFTGLVIFSIGTNLPELSVIFTAWRRRVKRLALGNVFGSAFTNPLIVGILAYLQPIALRIGLSFWIFSFILLLVVLLYIWFASSKGKFSTREGLILIGVYVLFLISELGCLLFETSVACIR